MRLTAIGIVAMAMFIGQQVSCMPKRPAQAHKLTMKEVCRGSNRPDWCSELYADLAHGREVREKLKEKGKKVDQIQSLDEVEQSHMEDSR
jgi:hypothetical protein